jgi:hypothetical protein
MKLYNQHHDLEPVRALIVDESLPFARLPLGTAGSVSAPPKIPEIRAFLFVLIVDNADDGANTARGFTHAAEAGNIP